MLDICNEVFCELAERNCLSEQEAHEAADEIEINKGAVGNMYASPDKADFARGLMSHACGIL
ncbi:MAG: hypothetical protein FWE20_09070 [Defluviitaleaceae bacterium]|nr:hypothetical protein [Defluviitaleaceae bacterium]